MRKKKREASHLLSRQDIRITSISDRKNAGTEKLTTSSTKINVVTVVVMNTSLGQHGIVFDFRLAKRRAVTGNDDQFGYRQTECQSLVGGTFSALNRGKRARLLNKKDYFFYWAPAPQLQRRSLYFTFSLTDSLQGRLVSEGVFTGFGNKLKTRVDGFSVLLGLDGSHCLNKSKRKRKKKF